MRTLILFLLCLALPASGEPVTAIADDGREVVLNEDGSWSYRSDD